MSEPVTAGEPRICTQWWRGDDNLLHCCDLGAGHTGECVCNCARSYSETVEEW